MDPHACTLVHVSKAFPLPAYSLLPKDAGNTSSPYVQLQLGDVVFCTSAQKRTLAPEWQACLSLNCSAALLGGVFA